VEEVVVDVVEVVDVYLNGYCVVFWNGCVWVGCVWLGWMLVMMFFVLFVILLFWLRVHVGVLGVEYVCGEVGVCVWYVFFFCLFVGYG